MPAAPPDTAGISVVVTVLNDREALGVLLPALERQTRTPDEVVFVDGGSDDGTRELLAEWAEGRAARVLDAPGTNISAGRNVGIAAAREDWIATTDAGCRPAPGWLEAIDQARDGVDFVAGVYQVLGESPFEEVMAASLYPSLDEIEPDRNPLVRLSLKLFGRRYEATHATGRSMAFHRRAWEAVGGFPEHLYAGEDVSFSSSVLEAGFAHVLAPAAVVDWWPRPTWSQNARMYRSYGRGDVRAGPPWRQLVRGLGWVAGPLLLAFGGPGRRVLAASGAGLYLALPVIRARRRRIALRHWWMIPPVLAMKDLSHLAGAGLGVLDARLARTQPAERVAAPPADARSTASA